MSVTAAIDEALLAVLQADSMLKTLAPGDAHQDEVPEDCPMPYVVVTLQIEQANHEQIGGGYFVARYQVKAVDRGVHTAKVKAAADRIDALLNGATFTVTGHGLMDCRRVARFAYAERVNTAVYQHRGFDYEVWAEPS